MALGRKKPTFSAKAHTWMDAHNGATCVGIGALSAAAIIGLFLFVAFSGFGASADFIYNQF